MGEGKRYAVLLCAEDSEFVKRKYGGYLGVFFGMLAEEGELWSVFRVSAGEFPSDEELPEFNGFVITGSCSDAHGDDAWILRLLTLLKKLHEMNKRVLGICFGHQILGRSLGGKTDRSKTGWDIGFRNIHILPSTKFKSLNLPSRLNIIQCHRDEIKELPPKAEILGWSEKTGIEMFRYGDNIMGIQGHPEYNHEILLHLLSRLHHYNLLNEMDCEEITAKLIGQEADRISWKNLCTSFLKGRL